MEQIKKILKFLRITDEQGDLSITNLIVYAVLIKIILKADAIGTTDLGTILAAILGYQGKRAIKTKEKIEKEKMEMPRYVLSHSDYFHRGDMSLAPKNVLEESKITIRRVNKLLKMLNLEASPTINSGYRDAEYNVKIGGSKNSTHVLGMGIDIGDKNGSIKAQITEEMLVACGLYMESPKHTPTWCHLQTRPTRRRIFLP